jgi:hypothetical protein
LSGFFSSSGERERKRKGATLPPKTKTKTKNLFFAPGRHVQPERLIHVDLLVPADDHDPRPPALHHPALQHRVEDRIERRAAAAPSSAAPAVPAPAAALAAAVPDVLDQQRAPGRERLLERGAQAPRVPRGHDDQAARRLARGHPGAPLPLRVDEQGVPRRARDERAVLQRQVVRRQALEHPLAELRVVGEKARDVEVGRDGDAQGRAGAEEAAGQRRAVVVVVAVVAAVASSRCRRRRRRRSSRSSSRSSVASRRGHRAEQQLAIRPVEGPPVRHERRRHRAVARQAADAVAELARLARPALLLARQRLQQRRCRVHAAPRRGRVLLEPRLRRHSRVERRARLVQAPLHGHHARIGRVLLARRPPELLLGRAQRRRLGLDHFRDRVVLAHGRGPVAQARHVAGRLAGGRVVEVGRGEVGLQQLDRLVVDRLLWKLQ